MNLIDAFMDRKEIKIACEGTTTVSLDELKELHHYKNRTREDYEHFKTSVLRLGFKFPVFFWEDKMGTKWIIDSHGRKQFLMQMRSEEGYFIPLLPAVRIFAKDKKEAKEAILAQESKLGEIQQEGMYEFIHEEGFELNEGELEEFVDIDEFTWEQEASNITEDEAPTVNDTEPAKSILGEVYQLGRHRLMCGDATKIEDVEKLMNGQKADMVFTDPPYGMFLDADFSSMKSSLKMLADKGIKGGNHYDNLAGDHKDFNPDFINTIFAVFPEVKEVFLWGANYYSELLQNRNGGSWFVWDKRLDETADKMYGSGFELLWSKAKHKQDIVRIKWAGVFGTEQEFDKKRSHPTQKPIALSAWFIERYSQSEQKIIDLFGGSGSTLIAAEQTNRTCYMMELDPKYVDVIRKRYAKFIGKEEEWEEITPSI